MGFFGNLFGSGEKELTKEEMQTSLTEMKSVRLQLLELQVQYDTLKKKVTPTIKKHQKAGTMKKIRGNSKTYTDSQLDDFFDYDDMLALGMLIECFSDCEGHDDGAICEEPVTTDATHMEIVEEPSVSSYEAPAPSTYESPAPSYRDPSPSPTYDDPSPSSYCGGSSYGGSSSDSGGSSYDSGGGGGSDD